MILQHSRYMLWWGVLLACALVVVQGQSIPPHPRFALYAKPGVLQASGACCATDYFLHFQNYNDHPVYYNKETGADRWIFYSLGKQCWVIGPKPPWDSIEIFLEGFGGTADNLLGGWEYYNLMLPYDRVYWRPDSDAPTSDGNLFSAAYTLSHDLVYRGVHVFVEDRWPQSNCIIYEPDYARWEMSSCGAVEHVAGTDQRAGYSHYSEGGLLGRAWSWPHSYSTIVAPPSIALVLTYKDSADMWAAASGTYIWAGETLNGAPVYRHWSGKHFIGWDSQSYRWKIASLNNGLPVRGSFNGYGIHESRNLYSGWGAFDVAADAVVPSANPRATSLADFILGRQFRICPAVRHGGKCLHAGWGADDVKVASQPADPAYDWAGMIWEIYPETSNGPFMIRSALHQRYLSVNADDQTSMHTTVQESPHAGSAWIIGQTETRSDGTAVFSIASANFHNQDHLHVGGVPWDVRVYTPFPHGGSEWFIELPVSFP